MGYRSKRKSDALLLAEIPEGVGVELGSIVGDTEAADDVLPDECLDLLGRDGLESFCFGPFGGIKGGDNHIFHTAGTLWQLPD